MNGIHDMAGMHGLGSVLREENEPVFHEKWEERALALARAAMAGDAFNLDEFRHSIERMEPSRYLRASYYERWLEGTGTLLLEKGVITPEEWAVRCEELTGQGAS